MKDLIHFLAASEVYSALANYRALTRIVPSSLEPSAGAQD